MADVHHPADTDPALVRFLLDRYDEMAETWQAAADEVGVSCWLIENTIYHAEQCIAMLEVLQREIAADPVGADSTLARALVRIIARDFEHHPHFRAEWLPDMREAPRPPMMEGEGPRGATPDYGAA